MFLITKKILTFYSLYLCECLALSALNGISEIYFCYYISQASIEFMFSCRGNVLGSIQIHDIIDLTAL